MSQKEKNSKISQTVDFAGTDEVDEPDVPGDESTHHSPMVRNLN